MDARFSKTQLLLAELKLKKNEIKKIFQNDIEGYIIERSVVWLRTDNKRKKDIAQKIATAIQEKIITDLAQNFLSIPLTC